MSEFEKQEALWDTENGMANREEVHTEVQLQDMTEDLEDDFEIPDIPAVFPVPEPEVHMEGSAQPAQSQPAQNDTHVWNSKTAKQQVKDAKKKYRLEKKRLRHEKRMRGPGWRKVLVTGLVCALIGGLLGSVITISVLTVTSQLFHIDLLDLKPEQIEVIREQYIARIQEYMSPGAAVYTKNANSVVCIQTSGGKADAVWDPQREEGNIASGVVYREDGYILTNVSAIRNVLQADGRLQANAAIEVYLPQKEGAYAATLVGYNWETDVALLHIDAKQLYAVEMGSLDQVQYGETVFAMLYKNGADALYIQESIISHLQQDAFYVDGAEKSAWKYSPLFSAEGKLIGLNSVDEDTVLTIPSNRIQQACNEILEEEKKP